MFLFFHFLCSFVPNGTCAGVCVHASSGKDWFIFFCKPFDKINVHNVFPKNSLILLCKSSNFSCVFKFFKKFKNQAQILPSQIDSDVENAISSQILSTSSCLLFHKTDNFSSYVKRSNIACISLTDLSILFNLAHFVSPQCALGYQPPLKNIPPSFLPIPP